MRVLLVAQPGLLADGIARSLAQISGQPPSLVTTADLKQVLSSAEEMIVKYPAAALAAAFFAGVAIAWWIKRK